MQPLLTILSVGFVLVSTQISTYGGVVHHFGNPTVSTNNIEGQVPITGSITDFSGASQSWSVFSQVLGASASVQIDHYITDTAGRVSFSGWSVGSEGRGYASAWTDFGNVILNGSLSAPIRYSLTSSPLDSNGNGPAVGSGELFGTATGFKTIPYRFFMNGINVDRTVLGYGVIQWSIGDAARIGETPDNPDRKRETHDVTKPTDVTGTYLTSVDSALGVDNPIYVGPELQDEFGSLLASSAIVAQASSTPLTVDSYLFESALNPFTSITLPDGFETIGIRYGNETSQLAAGQTLHFAPGGISSFSLAPEDRASLAADELSPYTLGFTFANEGLANITERTILSAVPEPSTALSLSMLSVSFFLRRRRHRHH